MNRPLNFLYEAPEDNSAAAGETPQETPETPAWSGPSQEEWNETREAIKQVTGLVPTVTQMNEVFQQLQREPEVTQDDDDFDIAEYIQDQIQRGLAPIMPIVTTAAQKSGQERLQELFGTHEKTLGKFDHKLAERAAQSFFNETGDPVKSVEEGAKYAAEYRKQERESAVKEYKESLKRPGPQDLPVQGGGDRSIPKAKSYDEVIDRWAPDRDKISEQTEV